MIKNNGFVLEQYRQVIQAKIFTNKLKVNYMPKHNEYFHIFIRFEITFSDSEIYKQEFYPENTKQQQLLDKQYQTITPETVDKPIQKGDPKNKEIQTIEQNKEYEVIENANDQLINNLIQKTYQYMSKTNQQRRILNNYLQNEQQNQNKNSHKVIKIQLSKYLQKSKNILKTYIFDSQIVVFYEYQNYLYSSISTLQNLTNFTDLQLQQKFIIQDLYMIQLNNSLLLVNVQPDTFLIILQNNYNIYQQFQIQSIQNKIILMQKLQCKNTIIIVTNQNEIYIFSLQFNKNQFDVKMEMKQQLQRNKYGDVIQAQLVYSDDRQVTLLISTITDIHNQSLPRLLFQQKIPPSTITKSLQLSQQMYKNLSVYQQTLLSQIVVILTGNQNIQIFNKIKRIFTFNTNNFVSDFFLYGVLVITLQNENQLIVYDLLGNIIHTITLEAKFQNIQLISENFNYIKIGLISKSQNQIFQVIIDNQGINENRILQKLYKMEIN